MPDLRTALDRLRRHYESSIQQYDKVSLLDLSVALRIWVDMKAHVQAHLDRTHQSPKFQTVVFTRELGKAIGNRDFFFIYLPGGVTTYAAQSPRTMSPFQVHLRSFPDHWTVDAGYEFGQSSVTIHSNILMVFGKPSATQKSNLGLPLSSVPLEHMPFRRWLEAPTTILQYTPRNGRKAKLTIPREQMIRRTANILGGAHPEGMPAAQGQNQFDPPIRRMMAVSFVGLPLPYLMLVSIAKEMLDKLLPIISPNAD